MDSIYTYGSIKKFCLSDEEMSFLGYFTDKEGHDYGMTKDRPPKVYYLDCEFVETETGPNIASVGIGTIDGMNDETHFVLPTDKVTNYVTDITGFDETTNFDTTFQELMTRLKYLIAPNDILVGHHMYNDLQLLDFYHPNIVDTCLLFSTPDGPPSYYSLKDLAKKHLKKQIQDSTHCPLEDARTAYELIQFCIGNGYIKTNWSHLDVIYALDKYDDIVGLMAIALGIDGELIQCIYCRGSRPIGTNSDKSDYDLVVVCDEKSHVINGCLTKYGNLDICSYTVEEFISYIKLQYIWVLECLYVPAKYAYYEKTDFRDFAERYRIDNKEKCNKYLRMSIGYEVARKIVSSKKHYIDGHSHYANKHVFIACRFINYGIQMALHDKIMDVRDINWLWRMLKTITTTYASYEDYKSRWHPVYDDLHERLSVAIPKANADPDDFEMLGHVSSRFRNVKKYIVDAVRRSKTEEFVHACPMYEKELAEIEESYNEFIKKMTKMFESIDSSLSRKEFAAYIERYNKTFHKYLFMLFDKKSIEQFMMTISLRKICSDVLSNTHQQVKYTMFKPVPKEEWIERQKEGAIKVIRTDTVDIADIRYIGGLDISFDKLDNARACAFLTVYDLELDKVVYEHHSIYTLSVPYISGFLGFREVPEFRKLLWHMESTRPELLPDVILVDGVGVMHHREYGSASQLGVEEDIVTIGVAKTLLCVDGLKQQETKDTFRRECTSKGDRIQLTGASGKTYGVALKSSDSINPIYVSIGHKISLDTAIEIVMKVCKSRIPEPIRNSDIRSKIYL